MEETAPVWTARFESLIAYSGEELGVGSLKLAKAAAMGKLEQAGVSKLSGWITNVNAKGDITHRIEGEDDEYGVLMWCTVSSTRLLNEGTE